MHGVAPQYICIDTMHYVMCTPIFIPEYAQVQVYTPVHRHADDKGTPTHGRGVTAPLIVTHLCFSPV